MAIPGALALCYPTPTRSLARLVIADPWPDSEDMAETIAHELVHAALSPLTALIESSDAAIMIEEQAVENIGKALASVSPGLARSMASAVEKYAPRLRARIGALAPRARSEGKNMDPKLISEALDALIAGDAAKCAELLKGIIAAAAGAEATEPPGSESPMPDADAPAKLPEAVPAPAAPMPGAKARVSEFDAETVRARLAATSLTASAIRARLHEVRTVDCVTLSPATEKRIMAAHTIEAAESILETVRETLAANPGAMRARTGTRPPGAPVDNVSALNARERQSYETMKRSNPDAAEKYAANAASVRARKEVSK
ncbi:MAG: hypothetical protein WCJ30_12705 [Deltaproteobacteria bacterium]